MLAARERTDLPVVFDPSHSAGRADAVAQVALAAAAFGVDGLLIEAQRLARMGSWSHDLCTGQVYLSEGMRALCGLSASSTVEDVVALVHEDDLAALDEFRTRLLSTGTVRPVELEIRDSTGDRTVLVRARSERDDEGTIWVGGATVTCISGEVTLPSPAAPAGRSSS